MKKKVVFLYAALLASIFCIGLIEVHTVHAAEGTPTDPPLSQDTQTPPPPTIEPASPPPINSDALSGSGQDGYQWSYQSPVQITSDDTGAAQALDGFLRSLQDQGISATAPIERQDGGSNQHTLNISGENALDDIRNILYVEMRPFNPFLGGETELIVNATFTPRQTLDFVIESNLSTGYHWSYTNNEAIITERLSTSYEKHTLGYGIPERETIYLQSQSDESQTVSLRFIYNRSWESIPVSRSLTISTTGLASRLDLSDPSAPKGAALPPESAMLNNDAFPTTSAAGLPSSYDWRSYGVVPAVRNQGSCGSCWAFGTVGAMEPALAIADGSTSPKDLSEQFLVSCNLDGWNCGYGGFTAHKYHYSTLGKNQTAIGAVLEADKPYTTSNGTCTIAYNHPNKLSNWAFVSGSEWTVPTVNQIKNAIYTYGPVTVAVCAGNNFGAYTGGIFSINECSSTNHMVVLVGWNDSGGYWILRNSWGPYWGESGYMRITYNTSRVGEGTSWVIAEAKPPKPTPISPTGTITANKVTYTWNAISDAANYRLYVNGPSSVILDNYYTPTQVSCASGSGICSISINNVLTNASYAWYVRAQNSSGWGPFSNATAFSINYPVPPKPTPISPIGTITSSNKVTYTWNAISDATNYRLYLNGPSSVLIDTVYTSTQVGCPSGSGTCSIYVNNALDDASYSWYVRTQNSGGWGPFSNATAFVIDVQPPAPTSISPTGMVATNKVTYTWNAINGTTNYHLYVTGPSSVILDSVYTPTQTGCPSGSGTCSIAIESALDDASYSWYVRAQNSLGWGPFSSATTFVISLKPPKPTPVSPTGALTTNKVTYTWNAISGATEYRLYINGPSSVLLDTYYTPTQVGCSSGSGTCSISIDSALANASYAWYVRAQNSNGWGPFSSPTTFVIDVKPPAPSPVSPKGTFNTSNKVTFSWNAISGATNYRLYLNGPSSVILDDYYTPAQVGCPSGSGTCSIYIDRVLDDASYSWYVRAQNSLGWGPFSSATAFVIAVKPPKPTPVSPAGTITANKVTYTWNAISDATNYRLYVNSPSSVLLDTYYTPTQVGCPSGSGTCFISIDSVLDDASYTWYVRAENSLGWGPFSNATAFFIALKPPNPTPVSPNGTITTNKVTYTWNAISDATNYRLYLNGLSSVLLDVVYTPTQVGCASGSGTCSILIDSVLTNASYTWYVRAQNSFGWGPFSSATVFVIAYPVPPKPTPISPSGTITTSNKVTYTWNAISDATQYRLYLNGPSSVILDSIYTPTQAGCSSGSGTCTMSINSALGNASYSWYVRAQNSGGWGPFSSATAFTILYGTTDTDGDSLPDAWEINGYDYNSDGVIDVDLPAMGAKYNHKDIFVEMDYMIKPGVGDLGPNASVMNNIVAVFNNAPLTNPDGVDGITIHLEKNSQVPYYADLMIWTQFDTIKAANFSTARTKTHHYMVWADGYGGGTSSGISRGINASDFIVSLGKWNSGMGGTDWQKLGTFIHELGHNLNLTHGGTDHVNYKPNYLSVMNYFFQTYGLYHNGHWGDDGYPLNYDYQRITLPDLNESVLNEINGLGANATGYGTRYYYNSSSSRYNYAPASNVDWNGNGSIQSSVSMDINGDGYLTILQSHENWSQITFNGGGVIGSGLPEGTLLRRMSTTFTMPELTWEEQQKMDKMRK